MVDLEVGCVLLKFGFVPSSSYWSGWWSCLWVGRADRYAVGPFWWKAVQGSSRSAIHLPSVTQSHYFAFRSREVKRLLLDLDFSGGTDPLGMFPLFVMKTAVVLAPRLDVVFRQFLRLGSFPVCWRVANVTPIPKGRPSYSASNYGPIYLTPVLSKVFERLVSVRL